MSSPLRDRFRAEKGSSLIEVVLVTAFTLVVITSALQIFESGARNERAQQARHDALLAGRQAIDRIAKDARQATFVDPASTKSRMIIETKIAGAQHDVVFELAGREILRSIDGGAPVPLADHVTNIDPFCYDPINWPDCAPNPSNPTIIKVTLMVEPEVFSRGPIKLETDIQLRNA